LYAVLPCSPRSPARKSGSATTAFGLDPEAASEPHDIAGQTLLDPPEPILAWLEEGDSDCSTGNHRSLASSRIQGVLEVDFAAKDERGRRPTSKELRELIFRMVSENPTWGAPRIHGELKMLGFAISERTVLNWMRKTPRHPDLARSWATFLANHREAIAAMDFFTLPTLTFGVVRRQNAVGLHFHGFPVPDESRGPTHS
jgi:hypothetical protein